MSEHWNDDQRLAIENTTGNMLVSASAGSGKTAVMIERVKRLIIDKGVGVKHILMLSFNDAIAEEIKEKMARTLIAEVKCGGDNVDYLREQIDDIGMSDITTMHSFCNSLIREYFDVVGVDPAYTIMDENESDVIINKAINEVFDDYYDNGDEDFLLLKDKLSATGDDSLREIITSIFKFTNSLLDGDAWLERAIHDNYYVPLEETRIASYLCDELSALVESALVAIDEAIEAIGTDKYGELADARGQLGKYGTRDDMAILDYRDIISNGVKFSHRPRRDDPIYDYYNDAKDKYNAVLDLAHTLFDVPFEKVTADHQQDRQVADKLMEIVGRFKTIYNREKAEVNKLDFNDLEHYAVEILSHDDIAREVQRRYQYVCVDEYQDINEVQDSMIRRVSNGHNLFVVGDPKQSIYGFRFTEPKIFVDRLKSYRDSRAGMVVELAKNYRSSPLILDRVNDVFDNLMRRDISGMIKDVYTPLDNGQNFVDELAKPFEVLLYETPKSEKANTPRGETYRVSLDNRENESVDNARIEANYIYSKMQELRGKKIYDVKAGEYRTIKYDDMVILASGRSSLVKRVLEILEREYAVPIDSAPLKRQDEPTEVKVLLDFLRTIYNPRQDIMLYTTMKMFFDFVDSDFVSMKREAGNVHNFYEIVLDDNVKSAPLKARIDEFRVSLDRMRLEANFMNVHDFLISAMASTSFKEKLLMSNNGRSAVANIDKFVAALDGKRYASTIEEFLYAYDNYNIDNDIEASSQILESCVHTTTIHKSKGLEYPIVFLIGMGDAFIGSQMTRSKFLMDKDYGFALRTYDDKTKTVYSNWLIKGIEHKRVASETEEKMRLLYVAMTRAKNCLYVVGNVSAKKASIDRTRKFSDWLYWVAENKKSLGDVVIYKSKDDYLDEATIHIHNDARAFEYKEYDDTDKAHFREVFDYEYPHEEATHLAQKYTVTAINHEEREKEEYVPELYETEKTSVGSIYHKFMEHVNYEANTIDAIEAEIARMVDEKIFDADEASSIFVDDVYKCMNSEIIKKAKVSRHDREKKFMMHLPLCDVKAGASTEKVIVQGIADLVIYGDENILVDFKKSSMPSDMLVDTYRRQLEIYAFALEKSMDIRIDKKCLYVIGRDETIYID